MVYTYHLLKWWWLGDGLIVLPTLLGTCWNPMCPICLGQAVRPGWGPASLWARPEALHGRWALKARDRCTIWHVKYLQLKLYVLRYMNGICNNMYMIVYVYIYICFFLYIWIGLLLSDAYLGWDATQIWSFDQTQCAWKMWSNTVWHVIEGSKCERHIRYLQVLSLVFK